MILIKTEVIKMYLKSIGRNQEWLARKMDITPGYLSIMINNYCKVSREMMECLMDITHCEWGHLFERRQQVDDREFYGDRIFYDGKLMKRAEYRQIIYQQDLLKKIKIDVDKKIEV